MGRSARIAGLLGAAVGFAAACTNFQSDFEQYCSERRCSAAADCCPGYSCGSNQRCLAPGQDGGSDAGICPAACASPTPVCDTAARSCVRCTATSCTGGQVCDPDLGCTACTKDAGCSGATPVCNELRGRCEQCLRHTDCTSPKTCNLQTGVCEVGGDDAGYDAGVPSALRVTAAGGTHYVGVCSGQWTVSTVDALDASVPFAGPVTLYSDTAGGTLFFDKPGCTSLPLDFDGLALNASTGRASFYFIESAVQPRVRITAVYNFAPPALEPGSAEVPLEQQVTSLEPSPSNLALTVNTCHPTPLTLKLMRLTSPASFSYDTMLFFSPNGPLELYTQPNCNGRLTTLQLPLLAGTSQVPLYVKPTGPVSSLGISGPGLFAQVNITVELPPDAVTLQTFGGPQFGLDKETCIPENVHVLSAGAVVPATSDITVNLSSDAGTLLYGDGASGCSGAGATTATVTIPAGSASAPFWLLQPELGPDHTGLHAAPLGALQGDDLDLTFNAMVPGRDGGP